MDIHAFFPHLVMTTLRIAELTGKQHKTILADTRTMFERLGIEGIQQLAQATVPIHNGASRKIPYYNLSRNLVFTLICGYSAQLRYQIIREWIRLEHKALSRVKVDQIKSMFTSIGWDVDLSRRGGLVNYTLNLEDILLNTTPYARPMSSDEIAEITGKTRFHVMRDVRVMLKQLGIDEAPFNTQVRYVIEKTGASGTRTRFDLPRELSLTIITGYKPVEMYRVVNRWLELVQADALLNAVEQKLYDDHVDVCLSFGQSSLF